MGSEECKRAAGRKAAEYVKHGMVVGLGTGSTVFHFIERLIELVQDGLKITALSSSHRSMRQAEEGGIPLAEINEITSIDITVDGADEIDPEFRMIKGGGGALLREKILANMSREMVVIVDESKRVEKLGGVKLPVEILPFACVGTAEKIRLLGFRGEFRKQSGDNLYTTDNGNHIYDIHFDAPREQPEEDHNRLILIPGVIETGYFFNLATSALIGREDGTVEILEGS